MIDPHWQVVDLDPHTWRHLGRFFDPGQYIRAAQPGEHGIFILHDDGTLLRIYDSNIGTRNDLNISRVEQPQALAQQLYEHGEWQRVHIINKRHLAYVAYQAQARPQRSLHLDEYYQHVYQLLWEHQNGYVCMPPHSGHWHGWTMSKLQHFVSKLPEIATLALGVFEGDTLNIGLILELHQGVIKRVTTFEALPLFQTDLALSPELLELLQQQLAQHFVPAAGILLCTQEVFENWVSAEDKYAVLFESREQGKALWYLIGHDLGSNS